MDPVEAVKEALSSSEMKQALASAAVPAGAKPLSKDEVKALEDQGCFSTEWGKVKVGDGFKPDFVRNTLFKGECYIGATGIDIEVSGVVLPSGIYSSSVIDSIVMDGALVKEVDILSRCYVAENAAITDCGAVTCSPDATFGIGAELPIAIETGGREVFTYPEITVGVAACVAGRRDEKKMLLNYEAAVDEYKAAVSGAVGYIGKGARIHNTPCVKDAFIGEGAVIAGATAVESATILSSADEKTEILSGAYVKNAIMQWGCEAATMAIVENSVMCEHSHAERHGKLTDSLAGPNTGIAEGEVTASLIGPFVGFHHQALLIAAFWPEGKGNVGYGANIGSNHTSKAPDQEIWPGEGAFFGLGVNIKFPADFSRAPYTIIASGVGTLPQKMTFPFSLINAPAASLDGVSPAYNEIMPGWVLSDNIFTIRRNEGKYKKRNKARRSQFVFEVFRPDIVDLMLDARSRLEATTGKDLYLDKDIKGLGKNFLQERSRKAGIDAYTFYICYYALIGLKRVLEAGADASDVLTKKTKDTRWEHERNIINSEFSGKSAKELLDELIAAQENIAKATQVSKEKDDKRGARIIPDYAEAHEPAADDSFVRETWEVTEALKKEVAALIAKL